MTILLDHCEERQRKAMVTFVLGQPMGNSTCGRSDSEFKVEVGNAVSKLAYYSLSTTHCSPTDVAEPV